MSFKDLSHSQSCLAYVRLYDQKSDLSSCFLQLKTMLLDDVLDDAVLDAVLSCFSNLTQCGSRCSFCGSRCGAELFLQPLNAVVLDDGLDADLDAVLNAVPHAVLDAMC